MKKEKLIGINNYCRHSHNIDKGKYVYSSKMYKNMSKALCQDLCEGSHIFDKIFDTYNKL